jgi:hypothetical protein
LIISDGICEDHDTIRRLVRQALEERIMVVPASLTEEGDRIGDQLAHIGTSLLVAEVLEDLGASFS